eukprot:9860251-Alexandrium_andersonii.AAC.1
MHLVSAHTSYRALQLDLAHVPGPGGEAAWPGPASQLPTVGIASRACVRAGDARSQHRMWTGTASGEM